MAAKMGPSMSKIWWEQEDLDLLGIRTAAQDREQMKGEKETDGTGTETDD